MTAKKLTEALDNTPAMSANINHHGGAVSPGGEESPSERLRATLLSVLKDEAPGRKTRVRYATDEQHDAIQKLRTIALAAYVALNVRRYSQRVHTLAAFLGSGNASAAGRATDQPWRTACQWANEFLEFGAVYISERAERLRAAELQAKEAQARQMRRFKSAFQVQCRQICGRDSLGVGGGTSNSSPGGQGCGHCPLRWMPMD